MADMTEIPDDSRRKLPPISPRSKPTNVNSTGDKPVKKKKKRTGDQNGVAVEGTSDKPVKRQGRRPSADDDRSDVAQDTTEPSEHAVHKPKRTKQKPASDTDAGEQAPETVKSEKKTRRKRTAGSKQDVSGSKTSLLSKNEDGTSPTTKVKKKKKKVKKVIDEADYTDSGLAAELTSIEDDVLAVDETLRPDETTMQHPVAAATLKSQPTSKIFVETNSGFKGQNKMKVARRLAEEKTRPVEMEEPTTSTSIEFALKTHRILKTFFLFCHGITAGLALWHIVIVYVLSVHPREDFLIHYQPLALPVQCLFYILLVCCTISAFDRHDISYPTRRFLRQAFTLQSGAVSVPIYFIALVFSVAIAAEADRINLYYTSPELWENEQVSDHELNVWKSLNTVRGVLIILGWFVLSLTPNTDRLSKNLGASGDFLGTNVEMLSVNKNSIVP